LHVHNNPEHTVTALRHTREEMLHSGGSLLLSFRSVHGPLNPVQFYPSLGQNVASVQAELELHVCTCLRQMPATYEQDGEYIISIRAGRFISYTESQAGQENHGALGLVAETVRSLPL
jgi:hypothetical protein